jgi:ATP-dependent protease ClpP protease subunit
MKEILINKTIGEGLFEPGITAEEVRNGLSSLAADEKEVKIIVDSPGGDVFEGLSIFNVIRDFARNHAEVKITTYIQGIAASMASVIALAASSVNPSNEIIIEDNSVFMIHNAWGVVVGNENDMRESAEWFSRVDSIIRAVYVKKTGKSEKEIKKLMDEESWFFGEEILASGFCDGMVKSEKTDMNPEEAVSYAKLNVGGVKNRIKEKTIKASSKFDFKAAASIFNNIGETTAGFPSVQNKTGSSSEKGACMKVTVEDLKRENPDVYAQILAEGEKQGVEKEKARASRFLEMGDKAGCNDFALECIKNGSDPADTKVVDAFFEKGFLSKKLNDSVKESENIPNVNPPKNPADDSEELYSGFDKAIGGK